MRNPPEPGTPGFKVHHTRTDYRATIELNTESEEPDCIVSFCREDYVRDDFRCLTGETVEGVWKLANQDVLDCQYRSYPLDTVSLDLVDEDERGYSPDWVFEDTITPRPTDAIAPRF